MKKLVSPIEFKWEGSKYRPQHIHTLLLKQMNPMPWPIRILGIIDFGRHTTFVRKDVGLHLWWIPVLLWYRFFFEGKENPNNTIGIVATNLKTLWWNYSLKYRHANDAKKYQAARGERYWRKYGG
jgi:hypothetical protein